MEVLNNSKEQHVHIQSRLRSLLTPSERSAFPFFPQTNNVFSPSRVFASSIFQMTAANKQKCNKVKESRTCSGFTTRVRLTC